MPSIQYMTPEGFFLESCQEGTPCRDPNAVVAPEGGCEGLRWDGKTWVDYLPPPDSCTVLQGRRALGMVRVNQIDQLVKHLDLLLPDMSPEETWEIRTAWEYGTTWLRLGREVNMLREIYGMTEQERDDLMRLANTY